MRRMLITFLALTALCGVSVAADELTWRSHAEAMPEAAKQDKPVIIHFTADWCSWCTKMKKETYTDPAVAKLMRDEFITAVVDTDHNRLLSFLYGVQSLPTIWIVGSDGKGIAKISGYKDARAFRKHLDWVASEAYLDQSFEQYSSAGH